VAHALRRVLQLHQLCMSLSSTTFDTLHTVNESSLEAYRTPSQHSLYSSSWFFFIFIFGIIYFKRNIFNGSICIYQLFNSEQSDRESGGTLPDSVRPSRTHPHPMRALSHRLLTYVSPSPALVAFPPRCRSVGKRQLQSEQAAFFFLRSIDFAAVGRYTFEFIVLTIWVGWCRVGDDEDDAGGCRLGGAEGGGECL
jgi:hypothetical protein